MCRAEALEACENAGEFRAAGASRVVALVKEDVGTEIADFKKGFWKEEVFMDERQAFYRALGGGQPHKPFSGLTAFLAMLANPFSKNKTKDNIAKAKGVQQNMTGEGFVAGGVYVLGRDGVPTYSFLEEDLGNRAAIKDVINGVKAAAPAFGGASAAQGTSAM
mmetsp:Transcript_27255/g.78417  ORF Transcript_27255/g.78417 Transcript_27255/m.78417 type:complete len:163 (-) Transcript_27255:263-751(-)